ncbi:MAG TPA: NADH:flavin oxidoreductase/NADH oxidase, partial [Tepidisphaeraceae bacterium]|nr:NADH:flavin oxidoreductase/NADH oxidase [Tepidisphaeraceae bacterium]
MSKLFTPFIVRGVTFRNRVGISPMCQYTAVNGLPHDWHFVHLASRAMGGAGLIFTEATAVESRGRISAFDTGLWSEDHRSNWGNIVEFAQHQGAKVGVQLAHAGWKASTNVPWEGGKKIEGDDGWQPLGVGSVPFVDGYETPREASAADLSDVVDAFEHAAQLAIKAKFDLIEIHAAHGYLLHSFFSPISNQRSDEFGGSFENRIRLTLDVTKRVRKAIPDSMPLFVRLSCSDWVDGGWSIGDSVKLARLLKEIGVDVIDCSSGGAVPRAKIPTGPGYQVPFAKQIRAEAGIATAAVGMIE